MGKLTMYQLLKILEDKSYFDLTTVEKNRVQDLLKNDIEAWTFIPHPGIIKRMKSGGNFVDRYIIVIETIRNDIYDSIKDFLLEHRTNINSYYTGGSADFICDAYFSKNAYEEFLDALKDKISEIAKQLVNRPEDLITVYRVDDTLILSGKNLVSDHHPDPTITAEILENSHSFEVALRNYKSKEAEIHFGSLDKVRKYINRLHKAKIILGFRVVFDYARGIDRQYVPLGSDGRLIHTILTGDDKKFAASFMKPVSELLSVSPIIFNDHAEKAVSHIAINEYQAPIERHKWRTDFYSRGKGAGLNMFSYPIEGTLNESPLVLTDLPDVMVRAADYRNDGFHLGQISHRSLAKERVCIELPKDSLLFQGLTLGDPGVGKTTTDIALVLSVLPKVDRVIIIDDSKSIRGKVDFLSKFMDENTFVSIEDTISNDDMENLIGGVMKKKGLSVIECSSKQYPSVFLTISQRVLNDDDHLRSDGSRTIRNFLLLEEAHDAFGTGNEKRPNIDEFTNLITKTSRKGWCVWASTQLPSSLGFDTESRLKVLGLLQNKIIHKISSTEEVEILIKSIPNLHEKDVEYLRKGILQPLANSAMVIGTNTHAGNQSQILRPIMVKIDQPSKSN